VKIKRVFGINACFTAGDMDEAERFFRDIFSAKMGPDMPHLLKYGHRAKAAWLGTDVPFRLELSECVNEEGPIGRSIKRAAPGFQFIGLEVEDIDEAIAELRAKGIKVSDKLQVSEYSMECMIHPKSAYGLIIELVQVIKPRKDREW